MTDVVGAVDVSSLRRELRQWLQAHWEPETTLLEWRTRLADGGWAAPTWPRRWGGLSLPPSLAEVVAEEIERFGAVGPADGVGMHLAAPTVLEHGSDHLKETFLRSTVTGAITWCQLFSEPAAGSDLAGLTTRATRQGEDWVVNGQKVWNTSAAHADYGLLLARTDADAPKHDGISAFALPMRQPGVEVRPLRQMNGYASFNEVFLTDARVPAEGVIGEVNGGWAVARTTLAHERRFAGRLGAHRRRPPRPGRVWVEAAVEQARVAAPYVWYPQRAGRADLVVERAVATGRVADPVVRQAIARLLASVRAAQWTAQRAAAARTQGRAPGPEGSLGKLSSSNVARMAAHVHSLIAGPSGMLAGTDSALDGVITEVLLSVPAVSIAGGTDEIQRTILGERILGLPREPDPSRHLRFRDLPGNAVR